MPDLKSIFKTPDSGMFFIDIYLSPKSLAINIS